ncbi:hypothetical protein ZHAS_00010248 [Anopheles sinensis]|uniref:Uncharacterized protein n=1 Tax=Anopheles sinensis TaxID=74873 RepID=A0A084VX44_ANOSI|nr:hypothetical protein ZHAS_00010248 [Anopheles sinensis]
MAAANFGTRAHSGSPASSTSLSSSSSKVQRKTLRAGAKRYSAKALPGKLEVVSGKRVASHTQIARKSLPVTGGSSTGGSSQRLGTSGGIGRHEHQQAVGANSINALVPGSFVLGGSQPQQLQSLGGSLQPMNGGR